MASSNVPTAVQVMEDFRVPTVEDFNLPTAERVDLLKRLQEAMGGAPPYFWAACQICDLKALEDLVELARRFPGAAHAVATQTQTMILHWAQKSEGLSRAPSQTSTPTPSQPSTPKNKRNISALSSSAIDTPSAKRQKTTGTTASSPTLYRNQTVTAAAKQRDNFKCVITGGLSIDAAHIYPFCSLRNKEEDIFGLRHILWNSLKMFWPVEKVTAWTAKLFPQGINEVGAERVYNLLTLSKDAHDHWNRGAFALKPIFLNEDETILKVQFFWQRKQNTEATMSLLTTPCSTEGLDNNKGAFEHGDTWLANASTQKIKSGDIFVLTTDDTNARPLPSYQLLELQWFLTRIVGMAGAAFPHGLEDWGYEDSDGGISNLGLDNDVGDDSLPPTDPETPECLRKGNLPSTKDSEYHREVEVDGD